MDQVRRILLAAVLLLWFGCDGEDDDNGVDDRTCQNGNFLVTENGCGEDDMGELTEFCVDGKWEHHSCNHPGDWPEHKYSSGHITGCSGPIHYQKWEQRENAAANLVFLNGRAEYIDKYHHLIPLLKRPWNIVMVDHYGQGRSHGIRGHAIDFDTEQVCDFGKVLENTVNAELPTVVMAHSMGGMIAVRHEQLHPGKVAGMVLTSPMFGIPSAPYTQEQALGMAKLNVDAGNSEQHYQETYVRTACDDWQVTHDCVHYEIFRDDPLTLVGWPTFGWLYSALTTMEQLLKDAAEVTIPILIFQADLDNSVLPAPQQTFCDGLTECQLFLRVGDYHDLLTELDREEIVQQSLTFLDGVLGAT